jgi:hypothetical protein
MDPKDRETIDYTSHTIVYPMAPKADPNDPTQEHYHGVKEVVTPKVVKKNQWDDVIDEIEDNEDEEDTEVPVT